MATEAALKQATSFDLPAPKIRKTDLSGPPLTIWREGPPSGMVPVSAQFDIEVVAVDIPEELFDPQYGLQLELLRYKVGKTSYRVNGVRRATVRGYVHPSNQPIPSGNGFATRGGNHNGTPAQVVPLRQTEFAVTAHGQTVSVLQPMLAFMKMRFFRWRDSFGNLNPVEGIMPWGKYAGSSGAAPTPMGRRFPYSREYTPGYFCFRYSYLDPDTGWRVHGPRSEVVSVSSERFPFTPDAPLPGGYSTAALSALYDPYSIGAWIGRVSRLP